MIKVGLIGGWHVHAKGYAQTILNHPDCILCGVWDDEEVRGKELAKELGCDFFSGAEELIRLSDAVIITSATNQHPELIAKTAKLKKHIFTEKVLAITAKEARELQRLIEDSGIHFTISFPFQARPGILAAKKAAEEGKIGQITYMRVRNVHGGSIADWLPPHFYDKEACGGGAMMDLGAHPMYLIPWFLGIPKTITSAFTNITDRAVEDNAVSMMTFASGAIALSETGFVSPSDPFTVELSGTKGFIRANSDNALCIVNGEEQILQADAGMLPMEYWIQSILNDTANECYGIDEAVRLSVLMEAAYQADKNQTIITFQEG